MIRRVGVNDELGMQSPVVEELTPDPDKIVFDLPVQRNAGPDAGMTEKEIPKIHGKS